MMKWIKFISSLVISYVLGFTLNKGLSATNIVESSATEIILNYNLPFIYTVRLNEIAIIISLTIVGFFIVCSYYEKSESSLEEIFKIMIKVLWSELFLFSFIIGTWTDNLLKTLEKDSFYYIYDWNILFFSVSVIMFLYICFNQNRIKDKFNDEKESDLYPSRKNLLRIIDEYLESLESLSIIGDWGIGKSKLIENFFYTEKDKNGKKYSDKYESIIIDVSSYSENKKIVSVIQNELIRILKKYRILKLNIDFVEKVFVDNSDFFKNIKNIFFYKESLIESKEELNKKIKELYEKKEKRIVLCLDNLERLSDVDRIKNLLSITDDLLGEKIKKIYLYDKNYMLEIFDSEKNFKFQDYINKYSGIEINVKEVEISEIDEVKDIKTLIDDLNKKIEEKIGYKKDEKDRVEKNEKNDVAFKVKMNNLSKNIKILEEALDSIRKTISNPRYLKYLASFIKNSEIKFEEYIKLEYRMIVDAIKDYTFENMVTKELFIDEFKYEDRIKKEDFLALWNKQYEKKESLEEQKIQELKDVGIKTNNSDELIEVIDKLIKDKQMDIVKEIFEKKEKYQVNSLRALESFLEMYIDQNIEIYIKEKMEILVNKLYLTKKLILNKKDEVVSYLICETFTEVKKIIRYELNLKGFNPKKNIFIDGLFQFKTKIQEITNSEIENFVLEIEKKFIEINEEDKLFRFIERERLKKELFILKNIKIVYNFEKENEAIKFSTKLNEEFFDKIRNHFIDYSKVVTIETDKIQINTNTLESEEIGRNNIDDYIKLLDELSSILKTNSILERLRFDIFLLKERIVKKEKIK